MSVKFSNKIHVIATPKVLRGNCWNRIGFVGSVDGHPVAINESNSIANNSLFYNGSTVNEAEDRNCFSG